MVRFGCGTIRVTLGGHSALDPPLPIPNRAVKRSRADDSMHSYAKVGHCQAPYNKKAPLVRVGAFLLAIAPATLTGLARSDEGTQPPNLRLVCRSLCTSLAKGAERILKYL